MLGLKLSNLLHLKSSVSIYSLVVRTNRTCQCRDNAMLHICLYILKRARDSSYCLSEMTVDREKLASALSP